MSKATKNTKAAVKTEDANVATDAVVVAERTKVVLPKPVAAPIEVGTNSINLDALDPEIALKQRDAIEKYQQGERGFISIEDLDKFADEVWNPGKRSDLDYLAFLVDIQHVGIKQPLVVSRREYDATGLIDAALLQGFLRRKSVLHWFSLEDATSKQAFADMFPNGIPVIYVDNIDTDQEYYLACDHDTVTRSKAAIIEQALEFLKNSKVTETNVGVKMFAEFENFSKTTPEKLVEIQSQPTKELAASKMKLAHRGLNTMCIALSRRLPAECTEAYLNGLKGIKDVPTLSQSQVINLRKVNLEAKGSQARPSDAYRNAFIAHVNQNATGETTKGTMARSKMIELYGQCTAEVLLYILTALAWNEGIEIAELNTRLTELESEGTIVLPDDATTLIGHYKDKMIK